MNSTIKMQEFNCPCCNEKFNIEIMESGEIIITPFILLESNISSLNCEYEFGCVKGGEKNG